MWTGDIIYRVASKYRLHPDDLEAGEFPPDQMSILYDLFEKAMANPANDDLKAEYFEQKAKFITGK